MFYHGTSYKVYQFVPSGRGEDKFDIFLHCKQITAIFRRDAAAPSLRPQGYEVAGASSRVVACTRVAVEKSSGMHWPSFFSSRMA